MSTPSSSSSSPPVTSSLGAAAVAIADVEVHHPEMEVDIKHEPEIDVDIKPSTSFSLNSAASSASTGVDMNSMSSMINALIASGSLNDNPTLANLTSLLVSGSTESPTVKREVSPQEGDTPKKTRLKVFSNGYFMTFDKVSSCQKKHFWRCEYKNTCKARMHTDILSEKILTFIHDHNHNAPTSDEIRLYGLDPDTIEKNRVYIVGNTADPNQRRKIRKQVADAEAAQKRMEAQQEEERSHQQTVAAIAAARAACAQASMDAGASSVAAAASLLQSVTCPTSSVGSVTPAMLLAQLPFARKDSATAAAPYLSPSLFQPLYTTTPTVPPINLLGLSATMSIPPVVAQPEPAAIDESVTRPAVKRKASDAQLDDIALTQDPMFAPTFEIAQKLRKLWKGEPNRYPRTNEASTRHFEFYLSKDDGTEEHLYMPLRIEVRDETHLKEALQEFCGEQCDGMLLFGVSPKISIMLNEPMLSAWDNNQFFLLDNSNPDRWRLVYVDDKAN